MTIASGSESQVNTSTTGDQTAPQAIALADGGYAVVWKSASAWKQIQAFDATGAPSGVEHSVFSGATTWAAMPDGRLAYAFIDGGGLISTVYFGVFNADGSESVARIEFIPRLSRSTDTVALAVNAEGHVLLAFSNNVGAEGILLDGDGTVLDFVYLGIADSTHQGHAATGVRLALAPNGDFLAMYDRADTGVQGRYVSSDGTLSGEFDIPVPADAKVVHGDGELTFAWIEDDENGDPNVVVGTTDGASFRGWWAGAEGTTPSDLDLWQLADGRHLITWTSSSGGDGDGKSVMGQLVSEGVPVGDAFLINSTTVGDQTDVSIAALADGRFVATWQTPGLDGSGFGIASRTFDSKFYTGTSDADRWYGGAFDDTIVAGDGNDVLSGEEGNDSIDAGGGDDSVYGGAGNDTVDGGDGGDVYLVGGTLDDWVFERTVDNKVLMQWHDDPGYGIKTLSSIETIRLGDDSDVAVDDALFNEAPTANDDTITGVTWGFSMDPAALLANDTDPDGDPLTITNVTSVSGGTATYFVGMDDPIIFFAPNGFVGVASFTYQVTDGFETSAPATVYLATGGWQGTPGPAHPDNHAPVAHDDTALVIGSAAIASSSSLVSNDSDADGDVLAVASVSDAVGGTVELFEGLVIFRIEESYTGELSFTYRATDGYAVSDAATVIVTRTLAVPVIVPPIVIPPVTPTPPVTHEIRLGVYGTHGDDLLDRTHKVYGQTTSSGNEDIYVGGGNDTVKAQAGDDSIRGDAGDDRLYGDNGRDTLVGGLGKDSLTGGRHADTFVFNAKLKTSNVDTIVDFKHDADIIALDDKIFTKLAGSLTEEQFYSKAGATKAHDKSDRIIYDSRNGKLYYDEDGSRKAHDAIHFATLSNKAALDFEDFAIV